MKRLALIACLALAALPAYAADPPKPASEPVITVQLTANEANVIMAALNTAATACNVSADGCNIGLLKAPIIAKIQAAATEAAKPTPAK